jgi:hypothetical protein
MMKQRKWFVLVVSVMALSILACQVVEIIPGLGGGIRGSGNVVTRVEEISDFDALDISDGFQVDASQGETFSVVIRVDDNLVEYLEVGKEGSVLKIGLKPGTQVARDTVTLEADVTMPELTGLKLSGGSHLTGDVEAGDMTIDLSGGSDATLSGSAGDLTVSASGGSHAKLGDLAGADASVDASGGSHATVNASGTLDATASDGSHIKYVGSPTLGTIETSGGASVKQQ